MSVPCVFIRDDDVWTYDDVFRELAPLLIAHEVPVIFGVIPIRLTEKMARVLKESKESNPKLLDIVQHGYAHQNYAPQELGKYEFGPLRTYVQQYDDISSGREIMCRFFGRSLTPGFVPPFHADDSNTIKVIEALQIPLYSARKRIVWPRKSFLDLPAKVYLNSYERDGSPIALDFKGLLSKFDEVFHPGNVNGMVFRHHLIRTKSDMKAMKAFIKYISKLRSQGRLNIVLFSDLLKVRDCQRKGHRCE